MKLLILGGTAQLGRAIAEAALARGHDVTCLARGSAPVPPGAEWVRADRERPAAYVGVQDRTWDGVVDLTRHPGQGRGALQAIQARHWVFVSSGNVYARFDRFEQDEDSPLLAPLAADRMSGPEEYGAAKVACEQLVREQQGSHTIIRSGLIGGWDDQTGRSGYYPWRFAHPTGRDVLVPPDLDLLTALLDVADLAAWAVHCLEDRVMGTFNAAGRSTSLRALFDACRQLTGATPEALPVPDEVLVAQGVQEWMGPRSLPLWLRDPTWRYFATIDTSRARQAGLQLQPLERTLHDALRYEATREAPASGMSDAEEQQVRAAMAAEG